jgi:secreted PhoX family phosphatase
MHAFTLDQQRVILLCNHELAPAQARMSAWQGQPVQDPAVKEAAYDSGINGHLSPGGVRRIVYNLKTGKIERQHLALCGTVRNCSGGATPWGSWISCEESVVESGLQGQTKSHGYCFEVSAKASGLQKAKPLAAMGRFYHEAVAVDADTGIVYLTEDRPDGLFYRFIPTQPGKLSAGGRLQALVLQAVNRSVSTANLGGFRMPVNQPQAVRWIDVDTSESARDDLRYRGQRAGAARFMRGEGMVVEKDDRNRTRRVWIMCTTGGQKALGQIFYYVPSSHEGEAQESASPGKLVLFSEPNNPQLLRNGDNLALMPNGDLLVCEDHQGIQRLIGVTPGGKYYVLARNPRGASEFTGATFAPDGSTLFVNMQQQGATVAITGPWHQRVSE